MSKIRLYSNLYLILIMMIMLFTFSFSKGKKLKYSSEQKAFMSTLLTNLILCTLNASLEIFTGKPQLNNLRLCIEALLCIFGFVLSITFSYYIRAIIKNRMKLNWLFIVLNVTVIVASILDVVSIFNGMYFYITADGHYMRGPLFNLNQVLAVIVTLILAVLIIANRKTLGGKRIYLLLTMVAFPLLAVIIQMYIGDIITLLYPASTLSLILISMNYYSKRLHEIEIEVLQSRLEMVSNQIKPHFAYNALTAIYDLCDKDPTLAKKAIKDFSVFIRSRTDSLGKPQLITFEEELQNLEFYLDLEKLRFEDRVNIEFNIDAIGFMVPSFFLQPIVENSIVHGICRKAKGGTVTISSQKTAVGYVVTVEDDGIGFEGRPKDDGKSHLGLKNVEERVRLLTGGGLSVNSIVGKGTKVTICFPTNNEKEYLR